MLAPQAQKLAATAVSFDKQHQKYHTAALRSAPSEREYHEKLAQHQQQKAEQARQKAAQKQQQAIEAQRHAVELQQKQKQLQQEIAGVQTRLTPVQQAVAQQEAQFGSTKGSMGACARLQILKP